MITIVNREDIWEIIKYKQKQSASSKVAKSCPIQRVDEQNMDKPLTKAAVGNQSSNSYPATKTQLQPRDMMQCK